MQDFEFDKVVLSVALAIFLLIFSVNIAHILYVPEEYLDKRGYIIEVNESDLASSEITQKADIPDIIDIHAIMSAADAKAGELVFKKCAVCHTTEKGGKDKVGPNLWNIVGRPVAERDGYAYSKAMLEQGKKGVIWNYEELYRYIFSPKKRVPGTKMAFAGIKKDEDRINLIAYLRAFADNPLKLP